MVGVGDEAELSFVLAVRALGGEVAARRLLLRERRVEGELYPVRVAGRGVPFLELHHSQPCPAEGSVVVLLAAVRAESGAHAQHRGGDPLAEERFERRHRPHPVLQVVRMGRVEDGLVALLVLVERDQLAGLLVAAPLRRALDEAPLAKPHRVEVEAEVEDLQAAERHQGGPVAPVRNRTQLRFRVFHRLPA